MMDELQSFILWSTLNQISWNEDNAELQRVQNTVEHLHNSRNWHAILEVPTALSRAHGEAKFPDIVMQNLIRIRQPKLATINRPSNASWKMPLLIPKSYLILAKINPTNTCKLQTMTKKSVSDYFQNNPKNTRHEKE